MYPSKLFFILALFTFALSSFAQNTDWWKHATFYQIYPRSFKDSNNDGIGDIPGIISKLEHLKNAGVTAVWLSPIFSSPQVDAGYDISNFTEIHYEYGTMEDFDLMVSTAHQLGLKVILDFVPNHSSDQHIWFKMSENREPGYEDFYIWKDPNPETGLEPNNWLSRFRFSAWDWSPIRNQYYLHQFAPQQPDLNYRNPTVVKEMKNVLTFWLDKGVDGFRVDAIAHMFEHPDFPDEPPSNNTEAQPWEWESLTHIYTKDQPETFDMVQQYRELVEEYTATHGGDVRVIMTEAYTTLENTIKYYGTPERPGAHFPFNFLLIEEIDGESPFGDYIIQVARWMSSMPSHGVANWVLGNHDRHRVATRFGPANVDGMNMLTAMLPGVQITYQGEEIGMENGEVTWEQGQDPSACNGDPEDFDKMSRDFERTPFHWDGTVNAGFNEGAETWLPVSSKYVHNNLALQSIEGENSHFHVYQDLMELRKTEALSNGSYVIFGYNENVLLLLRRVEVFPGYLLIYNKSYVTETVDLTKVFENISMQLEVVIPNISSTRVKGDVLESNNVELGAYEAFIVLEI